MSITHRGIITHNCFMICCRLFDRHFVDNKQEVLCRLRRAVVPSFLSSAADTARRTTAPPRHPRCRHRRRRRHRPPVNLPIWESRGSGTPHAVRGTDSPGVRSLEGAVRKAGQTEREVRLSPAVRVKTPAPAAA